MTKRVTYFVATIITAIEKVKCLELKRKYQNESNDNNSEEATNDKITSIVTHYLPSIPCINTKLLTHVCAYMHILL